MSISSLRTKNVRLLSSTTQVNLKTVGQTTLYTVPTGNSLIISDIIMVVTAVTAFAVEPIFGIGVTSSYDQYVAAFTPQISGGGYAVNKTQTIGNSSGVYYQFSSGDIIKLDVTTGATATTLTASFHLFGTTI